MKTVSCFMFHALFFGLIGCKTPQKASRDIANAHKRFPAVTADFCAKNYPVVIMSDTSETIDFTEIEMIIGEDGTIAQIGELNPDTTAAKPQKKVIVSCPEKTKTITIYQEDSAKISKLKHHYNDSIAALKKAANEGAKDLQKQIQAKEKEIDKQNNRKSLFKGISIGLGSILSLLLAVIFFLLKRKTKA